MNDVFHNKCRVGVVVVVVVVVVVFGVGVGVGEQTLRWEGVI